MAGGKTGYCSLCKHPKVDVVNEVIKAGGSFTAALEEARPHEFTFAKGTFFKHKHHVTHPLITAAEAAQKSPVVRPQNNKAVLEMIRDLGMKKVMDNPESVTVSQTLRAASILSEKENKQDHYTVVLAKLLQREPDVIEGEFVEVPRLETTEVNNGKANS